MSNVNVAVQRTTLPTSTGTHDVTISGFGTPKAAIFIYYRDTGTAGTPSEQDAHVGYGFTDGSNEYATYCDWKEGGSTHSSQRAQQGICAILDESAANKAEFNSWITDGVRLDVTNGSSLAGCHLDVIFFTGDDLSAAAGNMLVPGTTNQTRSVTGLSFQPNLVFFSTAGIGTATSEIKAVQSFGCAYDDGTTITQAYQSRGNMHNTKNLAFMRGGNGVCGQAFTTGTRWRQELTSFQSDGFTLTEQVGNAGSDVMGYLALSIGTVAAKIDSAYGTPTSTGNDTITTTFTPQFMLGVFSKEQTTSNISVNDSFSAEPFGHALIDGTQAIYNQIQIDNDNIAPASFRSSGTTKALRLFSDATGNATFNDQLLAEATFGSFSATGTVLNYTTVAGGGSGQRYYGWTLQIEEGAAGLQEVAGEAFGTAGSSGAPTAILMISSEAFGSASSSGDPEPITSVASSVMGAASSSGNPTAGAKVCASCQCIPTVRSSSTQSAVTVVAAGAYGTAGSSGAGAPVTSIESSVIGAAGSLGTPGFGGSRWIIPSKVFGSAASSGGGTAGLAALVSGSAMGMAGSTGNPSYQGGTVNLNLDLTLPSILSKAQVVVPSNFANILNTLGSVRQYAKSAKGISAQHPRTYKVPKGSRVYRVENYPLD